MSRLPLPLLLLALATLAPPAPCDAETTPPTEALREGLARAGAAGFVRVNVILERDGMPSAGWARRSWVAHRQQRVIDAVAPEDVRIGRRYRAVGGLSLLANRRAVERLLAHPDVRAVHLDRVLELHLPEGVAEVGGAVVHGLGFTGAGVSVAVIDSGIDTDHPALMDDLVAEHCYGDIPPFNDSVGCCPGGVIEASGPGSAEDDNGHGTQVSGIVTSQDATRIGIAPDAEIVALKVANVDGFAYDSDTAAALDWVLVNHQTYRIRVVNMSLGDDQEYDDASQSPCTGGLVANSVAAVHAAGIVVFVSSGNSGFDAGIAYPACVPEAISVGGVYDNNLTSPNWCLDEECNTTCNDGQVVPDDFVCHTNSGSLLDLLAPDWKIRTPDLGGGFNPQGGTSIASPFAAGQAALLLEADPSLLPDDIRSLLVASGPLVTNPDNAMSFPRADVEEALMALPEPHATASLLAAIACIAIAARRRRLASVRDAARR